MLISLLSVYNFETENEKRLMFTEYPYVRIN